MTNTAIFVAGIAVGQLVALAILLGAQYAPALVHRYHIWGIKRRIARIQHQLNTMV